MTKTNLPREVLPIINTPHTLTTDRFCILLSMLAWNYIDDDRPYDALNGLIDAVHYRYCGIPDLRDGFMLRTKHSWQNTREASCYLIDHESVTEDLMVAFHQQQVNIPERTANILARTLSEYAIAVDVDFILAKNDGKLPLSHTLPVDLSYFSTMKLTKSTEDIRKYTDDAAAEVWLTYSLPQMDNADPQVLDWYNTWKRLHAALYTRASEFTDIVPYTSPENIINNISNRKMDTCTSHVYRHILNDDVRRIQAPYSGLMLDSDGCPIYRKQYLSLSGDVVTETHKVIVQLDQHWSEPVDYWYIK